MHVDPHVGPRTDPSLAGVEPHAHADPCVVGPRMPLERELRLDRGRSAAGAAGKTAKNESPSVLTTMPSFASTAERTMS